MYTSTVFAGTGAAGLVDGSNLTAQFNAPSGLCGIRSGSVFTLFISDTNNHVIRSIPVADASPTSVFTTIFTGTSGISGNQDGGPNSASAKFQTPRGLACDSTAMFLVDSGNHCVRFIQSSGPNSGSTLAVAGTCGTSGYRNNIGNLAIPAWFNNPTAIAFTTSTNTATLYVADTGNFVVRKAVGSLVAGTLYTVSTLAGTGTQCPTAAPYCTDGNYALFFSPSGLALDATAGVLYVADGNTLRVVTSLAAANPVVATIGGDKTRILMGPFPAPAMVPPWAFPSPLLRAFLSPPLLAALFGS